MMMMMMVMMMVMMMIIMKIVIVIVMITIKAGQPFGICGLYGYAYRESNVRCM